MKKVYKFLILTIILSGVVGSFLVYNNILSAQVFQQIKEKTEALAAETKRKAEEAAQKVKEVGQKGIETVKRGAEQVKKGVIEGAATAKIAADCLAQAISKTAKGELTGIEALKLLTSCINQLREKGISATKSLIAGITKPIREILKVNLITVKEAPLTTGVSATSVSCDLTNVRQSSDPISSQEREFRIQRDRFVKAAQEKILDTKLNNPLMITASGSGGGVRAALGYTGHMLGLKESGLLDTVTYASGLSGGTWLLSSWLQQNQSIEQFKDFLVNRLDSKDNVLGMLQNISKDKKAIESLLKSTPGLLKDIIDNMVVKWSFAQPYNIVDIYGSLLAWLLLPHEGGIQRQYLSKQRNQINAGQNPMPIYTAQWYGGGQSKSIIEFNPYEIGVRDWKTFINSDGFGRKYLNGKSLNCAPPQSLGFLQGIWGSAFAARVQEFWDVAIKDMIAQALEKEFYDKGVDKQVEELISKSGANEFQFARGADVVNFAKGVADNPIASKEDILFIDLGIGWTMNPIFALYRDNNGKKAPNVIFMFDYQVQASGQDYLNKIKNIYRKEFDMLSAYAKNKGLALPDLSVEELTYKDKDGQSKLKTMTVFEDEKDQNKPVILFFPLVGAYSDTYGTFKFNYSKKESEDLINLTKNNLLENIDKIKEIIKRKAEKRV